MDSSDEIDIADLNSETEELDLSNEDDLELKGEECDLKMQDDSDTEREGKIDIPCLAVENDNNQPLEIQKIPNLEDATVEPTKVEDAKVEKASVEPTKVEDAKVDLAAVEDSKTNLETNVQANLSKEQDTQTENSPVKTIINELNPVESNKMAKTRRPRRSKALTLKESYSKPVLQKVVRRTQRSGAGVHNLNRKSRYRKRSENLISLK
jgi:hypothetical protein